MRIRIRLAYEGTAYSGWQIQEKPCPPPTIQGAVETALFSLLGRKTRIFGAGRTDAGVHAHGQVAHFDMEPDRGGRGLDLRHSLNALLPADIRILEAARVADGFDARRDALRKTYVYSYWLEPEWTPPFLRHYVWNCGRLDVAAMEMAMRGFIGSHDFASFQNAGTPIRTTIREIMDISLENCRETEFYPSGAGQLRLRITANGFLKQMARNIAGYLAMIGKGKLQTQGLPDILAARDRRALPAATAPAAGLSLAEVAYASEK